LTVSTDHPTVLVRGYVRHGEQKFDARVFVMVDGARPARTCSLGAERPTADVTTYTLVAPRRQDDGAFQTTMVFVDSWGNEYPQPVEFSFAPDPGAG
jgi:hypothetical protein